MLRLRNVRAGARQLLRVGHRRTLRAKLGPVLWQLPPKFRFDAERLSIFFALLPRDADAAAALARRHDAKVAGRARARFADAQPLRHALEVRHPTFVDPERSSRCCARTRSRSSSPTPPAEWPYAEDITANFVYVRLHGDKELYVAATPMTRSSDGAPRSSLGEGRTPAGARLISRSAPKTRHGPRRFLLL